MMQEAISKQIEIYIRQSITDHYANNTVNIFDRFIERCQLYYDQPAHSIGEIKLKLNTKLKGDIFEHFCLKYCKVCLGYSDVWLLADVPSDILTQLGLRKQDVGIDIIARDASGAFYAVQAKYRKHTNHKQYSALTWKQLSTFHAIVSRTGPYAKHIVITNADYCRHMGKKSLKDKSICYKTLRNTKLEKWMQMASMEGHKLTEEIADPKPQQLSQDEIRAKRLAFLDKVIPSNK